ncbi:helix-turn-helix transcriptional regulator [Actinomycetospora cinnamomea]|uniref:Regulatory LuxR family protein n=1 Tax=Actinomycetospora cinnamomea TaxID=663609 RepID=A0A2U1FR12_9PSEU|nr:helix-turn-helix transcriptional regulator [Actinomycetospora cinnamomea]PVZ14625.1 regulatory LuxR family protein [Actinomycetospora cinnamomea]
MLHGRAAERAAITQLLDEAWSSRGGALVLRGEPGTGKSALLADAVANAEGMRVLRTQGVESESPLAFAALQRLLRPVTPLLGRLPARQARALGAAVGKEDEADTDRFLAFLGALSLLAEVAGDAPVLAVVDDAHWLDDASAAALLFVARRVAAERVALLFGTRPDGFDDVDLPTRTVAGLDHDAALALLAERSGVAVPAEVGEGLVARTGGNPLALVELPGALSAAQLAGRAPMPPRLPVTEGVERVFLDRARRLPEPARTLLLVAAADDSGRIGTVRRAAATLGAGDDALDAAERSGLIRVDGGEIALRHPLVRSAVHGAATSAARRRVHRALAAVTDDDRRAWHLAAAAEDVDEAVAADLERVADRARGRGGQEAASAALERAAELTPAVGDERGRRRYAAALAAWSAGRPVRARALADTALAEVSDPHLRADVGLLRARVEWNTGSLSLGRRMVLAVARDVAALDPDRARELAMFGAAMASFAAAPDAGADLDPEAVPPACEGDARARCFDGLRYGLAAVPRGDWPAVAVHLQDAVAVGDRFTDAEQDLVPNLVLAGMHLQDDEAVLRYGTLLLDRARDSGSPSLVLYALTRRLGAPIATGRWSAARADVAEARQLADRIGLPSLAILPAAYDALLAALRGDGTDDLVAEVERLSAHPTGSTGNLAGDLVAWVRGVVEARPDAALVHLEQMSLSVARHLAAVDRLEAAVRAGRPDTAAAWADELASFAAATGSSWAAAVASHGRALVADADDAEALFRSALRHHALSPRRVDAARTRLAYGEHLRRARRRVDARTHLRAALAVFEEVGAEPWAQRARQELRASGESARRRGGAGTPQLTPQELQVATLVAQGRSNRDVAGQLFVSPRTVDFHLRNVFTKLGVSSRGELGRVVPQ